MYRQKFSLTSEFLDLDLHLFSIDETNGDAHVYIDGTIKNDVEKYTCTCDILYVVAVQG